MRLPRLLGPVLVGSVVTALSVVAVAQAQAPTLQRLAILGGRISLLMPADFKPLSEEMLKRKYPNANRPSVAYSNAATTINVAFDHTAQSLPANQLDAAHQAVNSAFKNLYPSAQWFRSEIRPINGRQFFLMELRTPAIDTEVRNLIVGTSLDNRLLLITFNVTKALEADWMPIGNKIIESIAIK